jgi:hypothetical protein
MYSSILNEVPVNPSGCFLQPESMAELVADLDGPRYCASSEYLSYHPN